MYGGNGDRRKYQDPSKNYGRRQSDYEQDYNKLRQQRDNEANHNHNQKSNYHQDNNSYENDSYFGAHNASSYQFTRYERESYNDFSNSYTGMDGYNEQNMDYINKNNGYDNVQNYGMNNGNDYGYNSSNADYNQYDSSLYSNSYNQNNYGYDGEYNTKNTYNETNYGYEEDNYTKGNYQQNSYSESTYDSSSYDMSNYDENYSRYLTSYEEDKSDTISSINKKPMETAQECDISVIHPAKSHPIRSIVFTVLLVGFIGVVLGQACRTVFNDFWYKHIYDKNMLLLIIRMLGIVMVMFVSYIAHIILHEFGHLVGGTLSGYSLISFRVFNIILVREKKKMNVKKYGVTDTAGECVMMPPEIKKGKYPYILFRISGIGMNLITSIISIILVFAVGALGKYPWNMWLVIYATVGLITSLYNGIPMIIEGIPNDGYVLLHMIESNDARLAVHSQLLIYAFLSKGGCYSDVPYEQFCFNSTGEIRNFLVIKVKLLEYKWHLEHLDFTQAAKCLEATNQFFNSLPRSQQYEINSEKMFVEIMCENDKDIVGKLYNSDVRKYIEDSQDALTKNRILMAYNAGVKDDLREAHKNYMQLKNAAKSAPIKGETELQLMLGEYIYDKFCNNK